MIINILSNLKYNFLRRVGTFLYDKDIGDKLNYKDIKHILIINWYGKFGDAIISSFIFRELKKDRNIKISVVTTLELKEIYEYYNADNIYILPKEHTLKDIKHLALQLTNIDSIIPLIGTLGFKDLYFINYISPQYLFSTDSELKSSNNNFIKQSKSLLINEIYIKILELIGIKDINENYIIPFLDEKNKFQKYNIIYNPFGSRIDKSISIEKSVSLLKYIGSNYQSANIGVLYSPKTKHIAENIVELVNKSNIIIVPNIYTISDSINILQKTEICISVDTSLVHIATGLSIKLIAIYYSAKVNIWLPKKSENTKIIFSLRTEKDIYKNMNNFKNYQIIDCIKYFKEK